jgi:hypothetical protein
MVTLEGKPSIWVVCRSFLRQGQPRHSDGEVGKADREQQDIEIDPKVFTSWNHGSRGGAGEVGRDAAGRATLSPAQ